MAGGKKEEDNFIIHKWNQNDLLNIFISEINKVNCVDENNKFREREIFLN